MNRWVTAGMPGLHSLRDGDGTGSHPGAIVEDQREIREGPRFFIDNAPGFSCVLSFETVVAALPALTPATVDVLLIDLALPECRVSTAFVSSRDGTSR
jgi:DNA-binding NarL/FixJ family response regulator